MKANPSPNPYSSSPIQHSFSTAWRNHCREHSGFTSDLGPARSVWTRDRTKWQIGLWSNPPLDVCPIDSNIDSVVARQLAASGHSATVVELRWHGGAVDPGVNGLFNDVGV